MYRPDPNKPMTDREARAWVAIIGRLEEMRQRRRGRGILVPAEPPTQQHEEAHDRPDPSRRR